MLACALGRTECIRQLLAAGAALDVCTKPYLLSPLMLACSSGSLDSVVELMSHFNSIDSNLSPEIALQIQDKAGVGLLKCSPYSTNIDGKQALGKRTLAAHGIL
jgi:ankyrin repeat protein